MNSTALKTIYSMIDSLSTEEKKKVLVYLGASSQKNGLREVITQEELDFLHSTLLNSCSEKAKNR